MIREISIQNFKSVEKLTLPLGRVNVLIGENGAGKSTILEGIALMGAAAADKLDNEFLFSRGLRVVEESLMRSAYPHLLQPLDDTDWEAINLTARDEHLVSVKFTLKHLGAVSQTVGWVNFITPLSRQEEESVFKSATEAERSGIQATLGGYTPQEMTVEELVGFLLRSSRMDAQNEANEKQLGLGRFLIYSPEYSVLRRFNDEEGQIQPVGIRGEGLFKMLQTFGSKDYEEQLAELKVSLELIGWFLDFRVPPNLAPGESRLQIIDRFLGDNVPLDQRSANEGFLFLLFYFAVFLSKSTPAFFAIDNVDASLNPRLCEALMRRLVELAVKYDKQVILTTHNPAILDGLNLTDDDQRLFSVYRTHEGRTQARRIPPPKVHEGDAPVRLSHAFLRGLLGGVPKNF